MKTLRAAATPPLLALALAALLAAPRPARAEEKVLKIATLAPDGSSWMKLFREWAANVEKRAPGLKIRFFAGGISGDEKDFVRKMRLGQLNGAAVTAIGLGLIQPEVRVFEQSFLFKDTAELDRVRGALDAELRKKFEEKGYVLINWGDVGPVHLFTQLAIKSRDDLNKLKIWQWGDDPLIKALFGELGMKGVNLGVPDVLPSLQTGMIDACYGSPLSTLALQWNTKVKYMTSMVISQSIGAQVLTRQAWDGLTPEQQNIVREEAKKLEDKLRQVVREQDNVRALNKMKSLGMQVVETPAALIADFQARGKAVAVKLDGQVWTNAFRIKVEKLVEDARAGRLK